MNKTSNSKACYKMVIPIVYTIFHVVDLQLG